MKKIYIVILILTLILTGCKSAIVPKEEKEVYAVIMKAAGNPYNELTAEGFREEIEKAGASCIVEYPDTISAESQIKLIQDLIKQRVDAIAIAANDMNALEGSLKEAMAAGIKVSTLDSNTNKESRMVFVNQISAKDAGESLVEAVYDISEGEGQWAILSTTSQATNQNQWVDAMKETLEDDKYTNLRLVDIVYGDDEEESSAEKTRLLLNDYPDLKVICAPTIVGLQTAAKVIRNEFPNRTVKVTGFGLPSHMEAYIDGSEEAACPYMYLWNPRDVGRLSAYVSMALVEGSIKGDRGETFAAGDMGDFVVESCHDGGTEVIVGEPLRFDADNIEEWRGVF